MKHHVFALVISATALGISIPAMASNTILCPDIAKAKQVAECPAEEELDRMFTVSCGFERDPEAKKPELCDSYAEFKRRKHTALWESSDGEFMGYVTCATPSAEIKMAKPSSVAVSQKNGLHKISCNYQGAIKFTMRTRDTCKVLAVNNANIAMQGDCSSDASNCKVECD
ncbi:MAG: hypothetical protein ABW148_00845 [Sedimenticola sp.]